jgi:uncharacterized protein DUF3311
LVIDRQAERADRGRQAHNGWYWLLALPFLALLYPPLYAHESPHLIGIPFFYWYQIAWLILTAAITTTVYRKTR